MSHRNAQSAFTLIELIVVVAIIGILIALLLPAVQAAREAARRLQCGSQLAQVGLAIKQYEQSQGVLPMGTVNETGPIRNVPIGNHMGWIPRILPHLEQMPLYESIDFNKGVYDPANQSVWVSPRPQILSCPSDGGGYRSGRRHPNYMVCSGGIETPIDVDNNGVFFLNSKLRSRDIPDGTSNTIWVGEAPIFESVNRNQSQRYGITFILPELDENDVSENDVSEDDGFAMSNEYVYGGLGWMSGTPGTIRNTGYPLNTFVGPLADWPMPFQESRSFSGLDTNVFPWSKKLADTHLQNDGGMMPIEPSSLSDGFVTSDEESETFEYFESNTDTLTAPGEIAEDETVENDLPPDPAVVWAKELPGQFKAGGYGSYHTDVVNFLFGDGSVHTVSKSIDLPVLQNMGNRADGQVIDSSL